MHQLAPALASWRVLHPDVELAVRDMLQDDLAAALHCGEVDLALGVDAGAPPAYPGMARSLAMAARCASFRTCGLTSSSSAVSFSCPCSADRISSGLAQTMTSVRGHRCRIV
jgi:hypothetical protein